MRAGGKINQKDRTQRGRLVGGLAALTWRHSSEGPGQAPWEGPAGEAGERPARALPSLAAATFGAFLRGARWVTCSRSHRQELTSQLLEIVLSQVRRLRNAFPSCSK